MPQPLTTASPSAASAPAPDDVPPARWLWVIYGSVLGPIGLIIGSSILYYRWRRVAPARARWVNKHAWIAVLLNASLVFALRHWRR